jgi:arsenate reductase
MIALPASDAEFVLLHNPRCSKSRAARALLEERGVAVRERSYLEDPLTLAELRDLAARLGGCAAARRRFTKRDSLRTQTTPRSSPRWRTTRS